MNFLELIGFITLIALALKLIKMKLDADYKAKIRINYLLDKGMRGANYVKQRY